MTNCGHKFCQQCIVPAYPTPGWRCPLCNQVHDHPAAALARNYFAEQLLTAFKAQSTPAPTPAPRRSGGEFGLCTLHQRDIELCKLELKRKKHEISKLIHRINVCDVLTKRFVEVSKDLIVKQIPNFLSKT